MQSLSWSSVVTICTTWFNIPRLRIFPTQFICMSFGILKQRMDLFLKIQRLAPCAGDGVFTVRYELSFYLLCRRNTCLKDYKLEDVTNGDPD